MRDTHRLPLRLLLLVLISLVAAGAFAVDGPKVMGANAWYQGGWGRQLVIIDPATGTLLGGHDVSIGSPEEEYRVVSVATDPTSGVIYGIIDDWGDPTYLATIDPVTGEATIVGPTVEHIANLSFKADGTLYGIAGKNATIPAALYTIDTSSGGATLACTDALDATGDGQAIVFSSYDTLLYHTSGTWYSSPSLESLTPTDPCTQTDIPYSGDSLDEGVTGLLDVGGGTFLATDLDRLSTITSGGVITNIGYYGFAGHEGNGHDIARGLATTDAALPIRDISHSVGVDPTYIDSGDEFVLTIELTNNGGSDATGVKSNIWLLSGYGLSYVSSTGDATCATATVATQSVVACDFGTVASGATPTVAVTLTTTFPSYSNTWMRTTVYANEYLSNPESLTGLWVVSRSNSDPTVTTTALGRSAKAGKPFTFHVTATNNGPRSAESVSVTSSVPGGTFISSTYPGCTSLTCNLGTLTAAQTVNYDVTVRAGSGKTTLAHTASISTTTYDTNTSNNSSTASVRVTGKP